jgi:NADH:ubiquinone oxidoreductase subunit 5 (subunit L)/multisubunit Na+/H+ antiporter MnhA subunit
MKKVKIGFWIIVVAFLLLIGFQNEGFFLQKHSFDLNLWVTDPYHSPDIYNAVLFVGCFLAGLIIAYLSGLFERFKSNKACKQLHKTVAEQRNELSQLKTEVEAFKNVANPATVVLTDDAAEETPPIDDTSADGER